MTEGEKIVAESFELIKFHVPEIVDHLYNRLFEIDPSLRHVFPGDMTLQKEKLCVMLTYMVNHIDQGNALEPKLKELGSFHRFRGIAEKNYVTFRDALLYALHKVLNRHFTPVVEAAWKSSYSNFYAVMNNHPSAE